MEKVSIREYAKRCGCSEANVRKAIKAGKIVKGVVRENGKPFILPAKADEEWKANINPNYNRNPGVQERFVGATPAPGGPSVQELKRAQAAVDLQTSKLKLEVLQGSLVKKDLVERSLFAFGQQIREAIMAVPVKCVDDLRAAPTRVDALNVLTGELERVLLKLSEAENIKYTD